MANTSVHFPDDLLDRLDREAVRRRTSRNRLIVAACEQALAPSPAEWPPDYFSDARFTRAQLRELRAGFKTWMSAIASSRRSGTRPPF